MTIWGQKPGTYTSRRTVNHLMIGPVISLFFGLSAAAATSSVKTSKPELEPFFSASGNIYQTIPQIPEKKQSTITNMTLDFNLAQSKQTLTQLELNLPASRLWTENQTNSTTKMDSVEVYGQQYYNLEDSNTKVLYGLKAALPANESDRNAGFNYAGGAILGVITPVFGSKLSLFAEPSIYNFNWETSDASGSEYNTKTSLSFLAILSSPLSKSITWKNTGLLYQYRNYAENTYQVGSFSSLLKFKMNSNFNIFSGFATKDRLDKVTSTQRAFSRDLVNFRIGLDWSI